MRSDIAKTLRKFALVCSGANLKILNEQCDSEKPKYIMIGLFILLTSIFASLSSGYALYRGFKSPWLAGLIGLLWGAFIFNVDRFIVSTIRKKHIESDISLREKLSFWGGVALRILLAILISIVISTPLELKYFEPEISTQIKKNLDAEMTKIENQPLQNQSEIDRLETENNGLSKAISDKDNECKQLESRFLDEAQGSGGTYTKGVGPVAEIVNEQYKKCVGELENLSKDLKSKIEINKESIATLRAKGEYQKEVLKQAKRDGIGFLAEFEAMNKLAAESESVRIAKLFISFLILILECTPILMKIMASYGPYDSILEAEEYTVNLNQRRYISDLNEKANNELFLNERMHSVIVTVEEQLMQETLSNIINLAKFEIDKAKEVVAREVVENWKTKQLEKFATAIGPNNGKGNSNYE